MSSPKVTVKFKLSVSLPTAPPAIVPSLMQFCHIKVNWTLASGFWYEIFLPSRQNVIFLCVTLEKMMPNNYQFSEIKDELRNDKNHDTSIEFSLPVIFANGC